MNFLGKKELVVFVLLLLVGCQGQGGVSSELQDIHIDTSRAKDGADSFSREGWAVVDGLTEELGGSETELVFADLQSIECLSDQDCEGVQIRLSSKCQVVYCTPQYKCATKSADDGTPCIPDNLCYSSGLCIQGECIGKEEVVCDDDNQCTQDICDPQLGCVFQPFDSECEDGNACTTGDTCQKGECVGGENLDCDDLNPCTDDLCDPLSGCFYQFNKDQCDDGNPCTVGDICSDGICLPGEDQCECSTDADCQYILEDNFCAINVVCDTSDLPYQCVITEEKQCQEIDDPCAENLCDPDTGKCELVPTNEGLPCQDLIDCVTAGICKQGKCVGQNLVCNDNNPCTDDFCSPGQGCVFEPVSQSCDDGDPCTINDWCNENGECSGLDTGCLEELSLGFRLSWLKFVKPTFCLFDANGTCNDITSVVNSAVQQDLQNTEGKLCILGLFDPFDVSTATMLYLGSGTCQMTEEEDQPQCLFTAKPAEVESIDFGLEQPCMSGSYQVDPPCFSGQAESAQIVVLGVPFEIIDVQIAGSFDTLPEPNTLVQGWITAFLPEGLAQKILVVFPLMPPIKLSELLKTEDKTSVDGQSGWTVVLQYKGQKVHIYQQYGE